MSDKVVIEINARVLERVFYWIIILVLAVLLVFSYIGDDGTSKKVVEETTTVTATPDEEIDTLVPDVELVVPKINDTCSDDTKNQDEVGVDCGGVCTDINGGYWYDNKCNNDPEVIEPTLSGKIDFEVTDVKKETVNGSGSALKVVSFKVTITNGEERSLFPTIIAHARDGTVDLNQNDGSYDDEDGDTPYMGPFELDKISSGETVSKTLGGGSDAGSYTWSVVGNYDPGDDFKLVVELFDDSGSKIDQVSKTVKG